MGWLVKIGVLLDLVVRLVSIFKKPKGQKVQDAKAEVDAAVSAADKSGRP